MSETRAQPACAPAGLTRDLRSRCSDLGVSTWCFTTSGLVCAAPDQKGVVADLARSPAIRAMLSDAVARAGITHRSQAETVELFPGVWGVLVPVRKRRHVEAVVAAVLFGPESCADERFDLIASAGEIDAPLARSVVAKAPPACDRAEELRTVLGWMERDMEAVDNARSQVADTGKKLAESFEEIALLYSLRDGISAETNPLSFTREACEQLLEVLSYEWLGVRFSRDRGHARTLAGETILLGDSPCDKERFFAEVDPIWAMLDPGVPYIMAHEDGSVFTDAGTEAVALSFTAADHHLGVIVAGGKRGTDCCVKSTDIKMIQAVASHVAALVENAGLYADQRDMFFGTLRALTTAIDAKDRYTCGHSERVAYLSELIAKGSGLSDKQAERIRISGLVHDIGKIGVSEAVLRKPGRLTDEEYDEIKLHPEIGHAILRDIPQLADVLPGVLHHHERYDGRGYPHGLAGEDIPLMARVIGLADAFDAMSSSRTYRKAMDRERVLDEVRKGAGVQFDPELAERFLTLDLSHYDDLVARHSAAEPPEHTPVSDSEKDGQRGAAA